MTSFSSLQRRYDEMEPEGEEPTSEQEQASLAVDYTAEIITRIEDLGEELTFEQIIDLLQIETNIAKKKYNEYFNYKKDDKRAYEVNEDE